MRKRRRTNKQETQEQQAPQAPLQVPLRVTPNSQVVSRVGVAKVARYADGSSQIDISGRTYYALWDTGATMSAVSDTVIKQERLQSHAMIDIISVHGDVEATQAFWVGLHHIVGLTDDQYLGHGHVVVAARLQANLGFDVLVGMDIIGQDACTLTIDGERSMFTIGVQA